MPEEQPQDSEHWLSITDFSAGCYSSGGVVVGNTSDRQLDAPLGAADALNTWSCYALPNKSLAALPGITQTYTWPDTATHGYDHGASRPTYVVGCLVHDELQSGNTEAVLIGEFDDGTNHYWQAYSYVLEISSLNSLVQNVNVSAAGIFGSPYPAFTRVANAYLITGVSVGASTVFTTTFSGGANPFAIGDTFYLDQIPVGVTGLALNTPYLVTAVGGSSGAWTWTITTPTTGGSFSSDGGATILTPPYGPVCVFPAGGPATASQTSTQQGQLYMYPNPAARSAYGVFAMMAVGASVAGQTIVHQSRILNLAGITYTYPAGSGFDTNENVNFTDPPLSASYGFQQTVLAAEQPFGYGGAGSISAGELFLVKKRGGAVIVTGDIFAPSVTILPGVTSTGNFYGQGASTPAGFVYASEDNGMWTWNGSNTSQKISANLDDAFFLPPEFSGGMESNNYAYNAQEYGNRIYTSNNWMLDLNNNAWWTYFPRKAQGGHDLFYVQPVNGNYIYCAQLSLHRSHQPQLHVPLRPCHSDPVLPVPEPSDSPTQPRPRSPCRHPGDRGQSLMPDRWLYRTLSVLDQESVVWGPITNSNTVTDGPQMLRFNVAARGHHQPAIRLAVTGAGRGDMPVIHSIDIRYRTRAHQAVGD